MSSHERPDALAYPAGSHAIAPAADGKGVEASDDLAGTLLAEVAAGRRAVPGTGRRIRRGWFVRRLLLAADVLGLSAAFFLTEVLFRTNHFVDHVSIGVEAAVFFLAALPLWVVAAKLYGLYDRDEEHAVFSTADEVARVFQLITVGVWLFYATSWLVGLGNPRQAKLATFWLLALLAVVTARSVARTVARRHPSYAQNALIVGAGDIGQLVARKLLQHPEYRISLLGFVDGDPKEQRRDLGDLEVLGAPEELPEIVDRYDVDRVIVAFSRNRNEELLELLNSIRGHDVQIDVVPRLYEAVSPNVHIHTIEGLPLLALPPRLMSRSSRFLKRCLDAVGAATLLALTAPLLLVIAGLIRRDSPGPILFRQARLGMDQRRFTVLKFRTMRVGTDEGPHREYVSRIMSADALPSANNLYKLDRPESVTPVGRWLRRTSLDELPQLWNVLRGDMSLVGPRPPIPYELEFFAPHHFERFLVPAGITGLWQVEARAHSTFREALDLDVAYARGWSFGLDMRLLLRTPLLMFRKRETG